MVCQSLVVLLCLSVLMHLNIFSCYLVGHAVGIAGAHEIGTNREMGLAPYGYMAGMFRHSDVKYMLTRFHEDDRTAARFNDAAEYIVVAYKLGDEFCTRIFGNFP